MKKLLLGILAVTVMLVSACNGENLPGGNSIVPDAESQSYFEKGIHLSPGADAVELKFTAADDWSISAEETKAAASWLKFTPASGKGGAATVSVSVSANNTGVARKALVSILSGKDKKTVQVSQDAGLVPVTGVKAAYGDFVGKWIVTGTEHPWFMDEGQTPATYSYSVQIDVAEQGKTYYVRNWETGYQEKDRAHLYYGSTVQKSIYDYLRGIGVNADILAWYDADEGRMHIDRQTLYNTGQQTVEFLADYVDQDGHTSIGSWNSKVGDTQREYTICDFVKQADGSVIIAAHAYPIAFMGYARYEGFLWSMHFNIKFAFPYSMVPAP